MNVKPNKESQTHLGEQAHTLANVLTHEACVEDARRITVGKEASGPLHTHKINKRPTSTSSASCSKSHQSTVVNMDGVTIAVSHPDLLKSLRLLPGAWHRKDPDSDLESEYSMDEYDL